LSLAFGWTPEQIAELTPAQLTEYLNPGPAQGARSVSLLRHEAMDVARQIRDKREQWVSAMLHRIERQPNSINPKQL
jgi:hypothetical protein